MPESHSPYSVVWPRSELTVAFKPMAPRLDTLANKTIAFCWHYMFRGDEIWEIMKAQLASLYAGVKFVDYHEFGPIHAGQEREVLAALPGRLKALGVDAVVAGVGATGSNTPAVLRASAVAEDIGLPTASLCCEGFVEQARSTSIGLGYPDIGIAMIPGHVDVQNAAELRRNILDVTLGQVIERLTSRDATSTKVPEPSPRDIVFQGDFEEVNRFFTKKQWGDGLPIVPPTISKIETFLSFTDRDLNEVLGIPLPDSRKTTIWNVAVNGVMAGCRSEYMPVLVAVAEAMCDPQYGVEHSGNTPGSETLVILNGPIIKELDFNYEQGALRDGFQANTTVGRFVRLYLRNVIGFLPRGNDKGTFGNTWRVVLAENEDALNALNWPSVAVANGGVEPGENAVTVARFTGEKVVNSVFGDHPERILPYLADALVQGTTWECTLVFGFATGSYRPLLIMTPVIANVFGKAGWSKSDVQKRLFELARIPARKFEQYIRGFTNILSGTRSLYEFAQAGQAPAVLGESADPNRLVPIVIAPEHIQLAVAGDPQRSNCIMLTQNGPLGFPTTKAIKLPAGWREKLRANSDRD